MENSDDDLCENILRRFNLLKVSSDDGLKNKLCDEFRKKFCPSSTDLFIKLIKNNYMMNPDKYKYEFVKSRLLDLEYSIDFVDYLIGIERKTNDDSNEEVIDDSDSNEEVIDDSDSDEEVIDDYDVNINSFEWRENQIIAITETIKQGFKSGIHSQFMGAGKSYIMLKLIDEHFKQFKKNGVYTLFCDKKEILGRMFYNEKEFDMKKFNFWKENKIINLDMFNVVDCVYDKPKDIIDRINYKHKKPMLLVCNNSFIKIKDYENIREGKILLSVIDECHCVSGQEWYKFLSYIKYDIKTPIIGFSATPLRPGAETKLQEIFSSTMNENKRNKKVNIISQYGLVECIRDKIVLPPKYHYVEVPNPAKGKKIGTSNKNITYDVIENILEELPYKKIICWTRTIDRMIEWYIFFQNKFPELKTYMTSFRDNKLKESYNCDFDSFCDRKSNAVLICVNKCREGSDIKNLDCGIYLDPVKKRSLLVCLQTSGRIIRPDKKNLKENGIMIDMFVASPGNKVKEMTVNKVIEYYTQLLNLSIDVEDLHKNNELLYDTYMKYKSMIEKTYFDKNKNNIVIGLDHNINIKIKVDLINKSFDWSFLQVLLVEKIKGKLDIDELLDLKYNFKYVKNTYVKEKTNPMDWSEWYEELAENDKKLIPVDIIYSDYKSYWKKFNWIQSLKIKRFYKDVNELVDGIYEYNIKTFEDYKKVARKYDDKVPLDTIDCYGIDINEIIVLLKKFHNKSKKNSSKQKDLMI